MESSISNNRFNALPNELLSIIFCWFFALRPKSIWSESSEDLAPEVVITHVCSRWRNVALATVHLWSMIVISQDKQVIERARAYLERAQGAELAVSLDITRNVPGPLSACPELFEIVTLIIQSAHRLRRLSVKHSPHCDDADFFLSLHSLSAPRLQSLSLCSEGLVLSQRADSDALLPPIFAGGSPSLTFMRLRGQSLHFSNLPLLTVTTLHIDLELMSCCLTYAQLKGMLTSITCLINLSIQGHVVMGDNWLLQTPLNPSDYIYFPKLESMRICSSEGVTYTACLTCFKAPQLSSLYLKDLMEDELEKFFDTQTLEPSFPLLRSLTIYKAALSIPVIYRLFEVFKTLRHFAVLDTKSDPPQALKLLSGACNPSNHAVIPSPYIPLPDLETLTIREDYPGACPETVKFTANVITHRESIGKPLKEVRVLTGVSMEPEDIEDEDGEFQELVQEWDSISVRFCSKPDPWPESLDFIDDGDTWYDD